MNEEIVTVENIQLYRELDASVVIGKPGLKYSPRNRTDFTLLPMSLIYHNKWKGVGTVSDIEIPRWLAEREDLL